MRLLEIQLLRIMFTVSIYLSDTMLMFMLNKNKPEVTDTEEWSKTEKSKYSIGRI